MRGLYRFEWNCGQMGRWDGVFIADSADIEILIGCKIVVGDTHGTLDDYNMRLITDEQDFIDRVINYDLAPVGHSPFYFIDSDDEEVNDAIFRSLGIG
jgi:hypothetical protein